MSKVMEREVTLNVEQGLYVIPEGSGYSCYGFDVLARKVTLLRAWCIGHHTASAKTDAILADGWEPTIGSMDTYHAWENLCELAAAYCKQSGWTCNIELSSQLIGFEGKRVEVVDADGEIRRFIVGKSTGWMPCHLEIANVRSTGGCAAMGPYKSVRVVR